MLGPAHMLHAPPEQWREPSHVPVVEPTSLVQHICMSVPQSLGVIDASLKIPAGQLGKIDPATLNETVFAISLEPQGGSPTGAPTGPVLYTGKLVATE